MKRVLTLFTAALLLSIYTPHDALGVSAPTAAAAIESSALAHRASSGARGVGSETHLGRERLTTYRRTNLLSRVGGHLRDGFGLAKDALTATLIPRDPYKKPPNGLAVAGFICSLSLLFTSFLGPLVGVVLSAIGLSRAIKYPDLYGRRNMALAGLIIGGVFTLLGILLIFAAIAGA